MLTSCLRRLFGSLSPVALGLVAALVFAFDFDGPRTVRADDAVLQPVLQETIVGPIMQAIEGLELRVRNLEASAGSFADSFTSRRMSAQTLCVADETGAETCLTKAQLDLLLARMAHAEVAQPSVAVAASDVAASTAEPVKITSAGSEPSTEAAAEPAVQETEHLGTAPVAVSGAAIVWQPEVEVSVVEPDARAGE